MARKKRITNDENFSSEKKRKKAFSKGGKESKTQLKLILNERRTRNNLRKFIITFRHRIKYEVNSFY